MLNFYVVTSALAIVALGNDLAVANADHGCALGRRIVHAMVWSANLEHGVQTSVAEPTGYAAEVKRCLKKSAAHAVALQVVVARRAVGLVSEGVLPFAAVDVVVDIYCSRNVARAHHLVAHALLVVDKAEAVAPLQTKEIYGPGKDVG